jgi:predicted transcriptional regulator YdeE
MPAFEVIGIASRTTNQKEATGEGEIPKLWQQFFAKAIPSQIPNTTGPNLYAVYSDYASDRNREYTYLVGAPVRPRSAPPNGMVAKQVSAGSYAVFTSGKGPVAKVIPAAWQQIWQLEQTGKLKRAYKTDFEVYDQRAQDPQNAQVDIYVGVE